MMIKSHIGKVITVMFLALTVLFPTVLKAHHHHSTQSIHENCIQGEVHIHQDSVDFCDLCLISITSTECSFYQKNDQLVQFFYKRATQKEYSFSFSSFIFSFKQLRAPPTC